MIIFTLVAVLVSWFTSRSFYLSDLNRLVYVGTKIEKFNDAFIGLVWASNGISFKFHELFESVQDADE